MTAFIATLKVANHKTDTFEKLQTELSELAHAQERARVVAWVERRIDVVAQDDPLVGVGQRKVRSDKNCADCDEREHRDAADDARDGADSVHDASSAASALGNDAKLVI